MVITEGFKQIAVGGNGAVYALDEDGRQVWRYNDAYRCWDRLSTDRQRKEEESQ